MQHIEHFFELAAHVIDLLGIGILIYGFLLAIIPFFLIELRVLLTKLNLAKQKTASKEDLLDEKARRPLARYILFGLELMIVSDIINTSLSRTLDDLMFLGGVVVIRTILSYFLNQELIHLESKSLKKKATNKPKNK